MLEDNNKAVSERCLLDGYAIARRKSSTDNRRDDALLGVTRDLKTMNVGGGRDCVTFSLSLAA